MTDRFNVLTVRVVWVGRERIPKEKRPIQRLCLGDLNGLHIPSSVSALAIYSKTKIKYNGVTY